MSMKASLKELKEKIDKKEAELNRLRKTITTISTLQSDLMILKRAFIILAGEERHPPRQVETPRLFHPPSVKLESIPNLVALVLREAEKPLTADQILPLIAARGRQVKKLSLVGAIYRCIKNGQLFKLVRPGTFGLIEWEEK